MIYRISLSIDIHYPYENEPWIEHLVPSSISKLIDNHQWHYDNFPILHKPRLYSSKAVHHPTLIKLLFNIQKEPHLFSLVTTCNYLSHLFLRWVYTIVGSIIFFKSHCCWEVIECSLILPSLHIGITSRCVKFRIWCFSLVWGLSKIMNETKYTIVW